MKTRKNLKILKAAMYGSPEAMTDLGYGMICDNLSPQTSDVGMYWLKLAASPDAFMQQHYSDGCQSILQREADSGNFFVFSISMENLEDYYILISTPLRAHVFNGNESWFIGLELMTAKVNKY